MVHVCNGRRNFVYGVGGIHAEEERNQQWGFRTALVTSV